MAMGKRKPKQEPLFFSTQEIPRAASHPFYAKVNEILERYKLDKRLEHLCKRFYKPVMGRPSMVPGVYFRMLLLGYFEGIDSERGIAWRVADSFSLREFLGFTLTESTPDHSTMSRTRRLMPVETHKAVFRWFVKVLGEEGLIDGQTVAIDATMLEANAAMRSIQRRDDGRTHLAHKAEHAVDLSSGAVVAITLQAADLGDTTTIGVTLQEAQANATLINERGVEEVVADKGYHSNEVLVDLHEEGVRSYIPEPERGPRNWDGKEQEQKQVYGNRRRMSGRRGKDLQKLRTELTERSFAHLYETGGMRRTHLRGRNNILKRLLVHGAGFNLSLILRKTLGVGKPRTLQGTSDAFLLVRIAWTACWAVWTEFTTSCELRFEFPDSPGAYQAGSSFWTSATGC